MDGPIIPLIWILKGPLSPNAGTVPGGHCICTDIIVNLLNKYYGNIGRSTGLQRKLFLDRHTHVILQRLQRLSLTAISVKVFSFYQGA